MNNWHQLHKSLRLMRYGDWFIVFVSVVLIGFLFATQWSNTPATKVQIRVNDQVFAVYSLNQKREIKITGKIGTSLLQIDHGKARFFASACHNQYCVHQGWLTQAGQVAICLPNQVVLELLGEKKPYDTLNY